MIIQDVTDPNELHHAREIVRRFEQWKLWESNFPSEDEDPPPLGSELAADDAATAWMQLSHVVATCLSMAHDNIRAVDDMLRPAPDRDLRVPMYAHYPILRSILEASAQVKWILGPDARHERIARSLMTRVQDLKHDRDLNKELRNTVVQLNPAPTALLLAEFDRKNAEKHAKHMAKIQEIAASQRIPWATIKNGTPPIIQVIRDVSGVPGAPGGYLASVWKIMSGLSHPSVSRSINHSTIDEKFEREGGVIHALVSASLSQTSQAVTAALSSALDAVRLYRQRSSIGQ